MLDVSPDMDQAIWSALYGMSPRLDELSLKFVIWSRDAPGLTLDVGCGDGCVAVAAVARGAHVMAVDSDWRRLEQLLARVPAAQRVRVVPRLAELPGVDFKIARFAGVHVARVLHLLDLCQIRQSLRKFFRWLYPDGKLFLSALTPAGSCWKALPGSVCMRSFQLLDELTLQAEIQTAGFTIEEHGSYQLPWDSSQICCGIVARPESVKPWCN
jgi:SAM-dependent methyltransferase